MIHTANQILECGGWWLSISILESKLTWIGNHLFSDNFSDFKNHALWQSHKITLGLTVWKKKTAPLFEWNYTNIHFNSWSLETWNHSPVHTTLPLFLFVDMEVVSMQDKGWHVSGLQWCAHKKIYLFHFLNLLIMLFWHGLNVPADCTYACK